MDPVVFFKMLLTGYLENICTDRKLEREFQNRLDLRFFIDHDLEDKIPDHSTIVKLGKESLVKCLIKSLTISLRCV